jgi:hypothetical protein
MWNVFAMPDVVSRVRVQLKTAKLTRWWLPLRCVCKMICVQWLGAALGTVALVTY